MATNKRPLGWTTIEESKALIKAGLNPDTADMYYIPQDAYIGALSAFNGQLLIGAPQNCDSYKPIPCWSFCALWKLLPQYIEGYVLDVYRKGDDTEVVCYSDSEFYDLQVCCSDYQIESVVKMVLWCLSNGYIKR